MGRGATAAAAEGEEDIEDFDTDGWAPLHRAAHAGDVELVRSLLARGAYVNVSSAQASKRSAADDKSRQKPIHRAAAAGHVEALAALLDAGADAWAPTPALELAAASGHVGCVRLLLERIKPGKHDLHFALAAALGAFRSGGAPCVPVLLEAGAPVCLTPNKYGYAVLDAARSGDPAVFRTIFEAAKDFLEKNPPPPESSNGLLESAIAGGSGEIVRMVAESGVSVTQTIRDVIPAYVAAVHGHADVIRVLAALGSPLEPSPPPPDPKGWAPRIRRPVCAAAEKGKLEALRALLDCGASIEGPPDSTPPLCLAAKEGRADIVRLLFERGADKEAPDPAEGGLRPLGHACRGTKAEHGRVAAILLEAGCDPEFFVEEKEKGERDPRKPRGLLTDPRPLSFPAVVQILEARGQQVNLDFHAQLGRWDPLRCPLTIAAERSDVEAVQFLLERGVKGSGADLMPNPHKPEGEPGPGRSAVGYAAELGNAAILRLLAGAGGDLEAKCPVSEMRPLEAAARKGHAEAVAALLELAYQKPAAASDKNPEAEKAVRPRQKGGSVFGTALPIAVYNGLLDAARTLLERGASPSSDAPSAAEVAAEMGHAELLGMMLEADPKLQAGYQLNTLAAVAARAPTGGALRLLLDRGADMNARTPLDPQHRAEQATLLLIACKHGRYDCAKELLSRGANAQDVLGFNEAAVNRGGRGRMFADLGLEDDAGGLSFDDQPTALELAAYAGSARVVRLLAQHGAKLVDRSKKGSRMVHIMERPIAARRIGVIRALLDMGADPSVGSPLREAAKALDVPIIRLLLAAGADPNKASPAWDRDGDSALGVVLHKSGSRDEDPALQHDREEVIRELIRGGADPYEGGLQAAILTYGATGEDLDLFEKAGKPVPLSNPTVVHVPIEAVEKRENLVEHQVSIIRALLARGLDTSAIGLRGASPLHAALESKCKRLVFNKFLEKASDVNVQDAEGRAPLHLAQEPADAAALLDRGAAIDARDKAGQTPAVVAAAAGRLDVLRLLVERGAMAGARGGELVSAACRAPGDKRRPLLGFLLELETAAAGAEGRAWPAASRNGDGALEGAAAGYSAAAIVAMDYNAAFPVEDTRGWLDLLMMCPGMLRPSEVGAGEGSNSRPEHASAAAAAASVLRAEGRLEGSPARGDPFVEACRGGFRLCALRLAAAIPTEAVDLPDARGETPLWHAVAGGPPMLDACLALIQRGADLGAQIGKAGERRLVLDATRDAEFRARLKRGAARRDVFISYGHHPPEVARFTAQLRDRLQLQGLSCWMDEMKATGIEAGTEWREQIGSGLKSARAVVFVASKHSCASDWCRKELTRARDLGIPVLPVWREAVSPLQPETASLLRSSPSSDFTTDALLEAGFDEFLARLRLAVQQAASAEGDDREPIAGDARAALLAAASASVSSADPASPLYYVWCLPQDASYGLAVVRGLAFQGRRCSAECPADDGSSDADAEAEAALRACALFVPLVSPAAAAGPALPRRLAAARGLGRPVRPVPLTDLRVPASLQYSLARTRGFFFPASDPASFFPCLDALLATVRDAKLAAAHPSMASHGPAPAQADGGLARLRAELERRRAEVEQLERRAAEAAPGTGAPAAAPEVGRAAPAAPPVRGEGAGGRGTAPSATPPGSAPREGGSRACTLM